MQIKGYWKDTYIYPSIYRLKPKIVEGVWQKNTICTSGLKCITMMLRNETGLGFGINNIWYAVGNGLVDWDTTPVSASNSDIKLVSEALPSTQARKNPSVLSYYSGGYSTETPSNELYMEVILSPTDLVGQYLREFGIFIGNATQETDSGYMLNHVTHRAIHKGTFSLRRQLRIVFNY